MAIAAKLHVEHPDLALARTLAAVPSATVRVVSQAGTDPEHDLFPFFVDCDDRDAFESALEDDHTVATFDCIAAADTGRLYHIGHTDETQLLTPKTTEVGGMMLEAESHGSGWTVQLRLPDRRALHAIWEFAREEGFQFDLVEVFQEADGTAERSYGLTEEQRETLLVAYAEGYFEQPREMALQELADELDISPTAASGRLRRGIEHLLETTLAAEE